MKKTRFTETQIISILKEGELGIPVTDILRTHGISRPTYYNWKAKYGGLNTSQLRRLKELEAENTKLKQLYANASLESMALKELIEKKL